MRADDQDLNSTQLQRPKKKKNYPHLLVLKTETQDKLSPAVETGAINKWNSCRTCRKLKNFAAISNSWTWGKLESLESND